MAQKPAGSRQCNSVGVDGIDYRISVPLDDAFVHDLLNLPSDEMIEKYGLVEWDEQEEEEEV